MVASHLTLDRGVITNLQKILGHASVEQTQQYGQTDSDRVFRVPGSMQELSNRLV